MESHGGELIGAAGRYFPGIDATLEGDFGFPDEYLVSTIILFVSVQIKR
ncbi:MAG: hypothetical protein WAM88_08830 [Nitrososphaeraceae archaeon]